MFQFKQFEVEDDRSSQKVGNDAVLLGAWARSIHNENPSRILDIGTGCGVVALMMAQHYPMAEVHGIDLDPASIEEATGNIARSPWSDNVKVFLSPLQHYQTESRYNLIVSNPPFFTNSLKGPNAQRNTARHTDTLPFVELLEHAARLLAPDGTFCVMLPTPDADNLVRKARLHYNLNLQRRLDIRTRLDLPVKRSLLALSHEVPQEADIRELVLREADNTNSKAHKELTAAFYL